MNLGALSLLLSVSLCAPVTPYSLLVDCLSLFPVHMVKNGWQLPRLHSSPNTKTRRGDHSVFQIWVKKLPGWLAQLDLDMLPWVKEASSLYQNTASAVTVWKQEGKGKFLEKRVLEAQSKKCPPEPSMEHVLTSSPSENLVPLVLHSAIWTLVLVKCLLMGTSSAPVGTFSLSSWRAGTGLEFFVFCTAYPVLHLVNAPSSCWENTYTYQELFWALYTLTHLILGIILQGTNIWGDLRGKLHVQYDIVGGWARIQTQTEWHSGLGS